jgi:hypothetical protein
MSETKTEALAVTRSEQRIDKSGWGPGPWQDEPDFVEWQSAEPPHFRCQVNRNEIGGVFCGYVAVPPGHPAHGKGAGEVEVEVHGDVTFGSEAIGGGWAIGFDCGHAWDFQPAMEARLKAQLPPGMYAAQQRVLSDMPGGSTYKTLAFVRAEVESLARQLAAMGPPVLTEGQAELAAEDPDPLDRTLDVGNGERMTIGAIVDEIFPEEREQRS